MWEAGVPVLDTLQTTLGRPEVLSSGSYPTVLTSATSLDSAIWHAMPGTDVASGDTRAPRTGTTSMRCVLSTYARCVRCQVLTGGMWKPVGEPRGHVQRQHDLQNKRTHPNEQSMQLDMSCVL
eukprot:1243474-Rhodomonas_salina.3